MAFGVDGRAVGLNCLLLLALYLQEFRTPLQGIMGAASTMLDDLKPENGNMFDSVSTISASARLLLTLINNILDLGKIEADKMQEVELSTIPILLPIRESITFCEHFAAINETKIVLEDPDPDWIMKTNRIRLQQVKPTPVTCKDLSNFQSKLTNLKPDFYLCRFW